MPHLAPIPPDETPDHPYCARPPSAFTALITAEVCRARAVHGAIPDLRSGTALLRAELAAVERIACADHGSPILLLALLARIGALAQRLAEDCLPPRRADPVPPATVAGIGEEGSAHG